MDLYFSLVNNDKTESLLSNLAKEGEPQIRDSVNAHTSGQRNYYLGYVIKLTFISTIGGFLFGYDTGVIAGAQLYFNETWPTITELEKGVRFLYTQNIDYRIASSIGGGGWLTLCWTHIRYLGKETNHHGLRRLIYDWSHNHGRGTIDLDPHLRPLHRWST